MTSQRELGQAFAEGATSGNGSNVAIMGNKLIGYGWAVYFTRNADGTITEHGWRGYSVSTSCALTKMRGGMIAAGATFTENDPQRIKA